MVLLVLLSIALMMMDHRQKHIDSLRAGLSLLVYPLQLAVEMPGAVSDWFRESLATRRQLQEDNVSLRTQLLMLKAQSQKLASLETENIRLRELLDSSFKIGERVLVAELMSVDLDPYQHQVLINKGELDRIYPGQPILDADGVMGQIVNVGPYTSTALLITDTSHAIPVQVNRNGIRTIALGSGAINRLELPYIPNNADIQPGDLLVTSGLGGRFPPGYPVAIVQGVQHDPGRSFAAVIATPSAKLNRSREVLLVWPEDTSTLESNGAALIEAQDLDPQGTPGEAATATDAEPAVPAEPGASETPAEETP